MEEEDAAISAIMVVQPPLEFKPGPRQPGLNSRDADSQIGGDISELALAEIPHDQDFTQKWRKSINFLVEQREDFVVLHCLVGACPLIDHLQLEGFFGIKYLIQ